MNNATLTLDQTADFDFAPARTVVPRATANPARQSDTHVFGQLAAFCTRVLLLGGRSPLDEPSLSRDLLSVYSYGALEMLASDAGLDATGRTNLVTRLLHEVMQLPIEEAALRASTLVNAAEWATSQLLEIVRRGAHAFAQWLSDPTGFVPEDFRRLVAAGATHPALN